jgi:methyl-accepting chemotaxis protein
MTTTILIALVVLLIIINIASIWLTKKGLTKDNNNNMIPDVLETKLAQIKSDVSKRVDRVGQELKDVTKAIKEVGNQIGDVPSAMKGQNRSGKKSNKK